jgi:hypothetical protein
MYTHVTGSMSANVAMRHKVVVSASCTVDGSRDVTPSN